VEPDGNRYTGRPHRPVAFRGVRRRTPRRRGQPRILRMVVPQPPARRSCTKAGRWPWCARLPRPAISPSAPQRRSDRRGVILTVASRLHPSRDRNVRSHGLCLWPLKNQRLAQAPAVGTRFLGRRASKRASALSMGVSRASNHPGNVDRGEDRRGRAGRDGNHRHRTDLAASMCRPGDWSCGQVEISPHAPRSGP